MTAPPFDLRADSICGAEGVVAGVTEALGVEGCDVPSELRATT
jgi:hypothetical protein